MGRCLGTTPQILCGLPEECTPSLGASPAFLFETWESKISFWELHFCDIRDFLGRFKDLLTPIVAPPSKNTPSLKPLIFFFYQNLHTVFFSGEGFPVGFSWADSKQNPTKQGLRFIFYLFTPPPAKVCALSFLIMTFFRNPSFPVPKVPTNGC